VTASPEEEHVLRAFLINFEKHTLPRALRIKEEVDNGGLLSDGELAFLEQVISETSHAKTLVDRHPDLQALYAHAVGLYDAITARALKNEEQADLDAGK
jgi:hypothetical protein